MSVPGVRQRAGIVSVTGPRETNEDAYFVSDDTLDSGFVSARLAVADGMGGHHAGDVASSLAVATVAEALGPGSDLDGGAVEDAFARADQQIRAYSRENARGMSMGTTLTFVFVRGSEALIGHVGDSRAWLLHEGRLEQITEDHSRVGQLLRSGAITEGEALGHPEANVLEQALGAGDVPLVELRRVGIGPSDVLVLSSDGLHGVVSRGDIEAVLAGQVSMQHACEKLAALAQQAGSGDNVTVVAWQYPLARLRTATNPGRPPTHVAPPRPRPRSARMPTSAQDVRWLLLAVAFLAGVLNGVALRLAAR
ncbi:MAG: PP2C family protein-serine/threonine phosphatase [Acidimicrobiales bacterium]